MPRTVRTSSRDFNPGLLKQELTPQLPAFDLTMAGFDIVYSRLVTPSAASKVITDSTDSTGNTKTSANPAELWIDTSKALTSTQKTNLDKTLTNHVETNRSNEQIEEDTDTTDLDFLIANWATFESKSQAEKDDMTKRAIRLALRDNDRL